MRRVSYHERLATQQRQESEDRIRFVAEVNQKRFDRALARLQEVDPLGWAHWYDGPAIPEQINWRDEVQMTSIIATITERVEIFAPQADAFELARFLEHWQEVSYA